MSTTHSSAGRPGGSSGLGWMPPDVAIHETPEHEVRFISGRTVYVEALLEGRWVGRYWTADGRINWLYDRWAEDAFQLEINRELLSTGWRWVSAFEAPRTGRGARHFVVELSNDARPIGVKVHTLLDGTPVLTRWLEVSNAGGEPVALTGVSPWSSRLWAQTDYRNYPPHGLDHAFSLGYFSKSDWGWEGWFEWEPLSGGTTLLKGDRGQGFDAPFFIVRNRAKGESRA